MHRVQSGSIAEVGFDLYAKLMDEALRELRGVTTVSAIGFFQLVGGS